MQWDTLCIFSSRRRNTRWNCDWSSDVCSSDLPLLLKSTLTGRPAPSRYCEGKLNGSLGFVIVFGGTVFRPFASLPSVGPLFACPQLSPSVSALVGFVNCMYSWMLLRPSPSGSSFGPCEIGEVRIFE